MKRASNGSRWDRGTDPRAAFVAGVKVIDPMFKRGELEAFWPMLRELVAIAPERRDVSQKKSHYLASLAARSLSRDDPRAALEFLDLADRIVEPTHLTDFLIDERKAFRREAERALTTRADPPPKVR